MVASVDVSAVWKAPTEDAEVIPALQKAAAAAGANLAFCPRNQKPTFHVWHCYLVKSMTSKSPRGGSAAHGPHFRRNPGRRRHADSLHQQAGRGARHRHCRAVHHFARPGDERSPLAGHRAGRSLPLKRTLSNDRTGVRRGSQVPGRGAEASAAARVTAAVEAHSARAALEPAQRDTRRRFAHAS